MCGILGEFFNQAPKELGNFLGQLDKIAHRGPDGQGVVAFNDESRVSIKDSVPLSRSPGNLQHCYTDVLAHVRLSIIDLHSHGLQPFEYKGISLAFNGEVYNYLELRKELEDSGYTFETDTDTEVVLKSYLAWGNECFSRFNGMWGICIYDRNEETVLLSRDRFGIKPLYYSYLNGVLQVCSETKALNRTFINKKTLALFLEQNIIDHSEETLFEGIHQVMPGSLMLFNKNGVVEANKYFSVYEDFNSDLDIYGLIRESIKLRNRADVDIGGLLSGGMDSSVIAGVTKRINNNYKLFSAVFEDGIHCEKEYIKATKEYLDLDVTYLKPNEGKLSDEVENQVVIQESPLRSMAQVYQYQLYKYISENTDIKVVFNGQGADEILSGYNEHIVCYYFELLKRIRIIELFKEISKYAEITGKSKVNIFRKIISLGIVRKKRNKITRDSINLITPPSDVRKRLEFNLQVSALPEYLKYDDRNSMAVGLESRLPFLDYRLVLQSLSLPSSSRIKSGVAKIPLREIAKEHYLVAPKVLNRKDKAGFVSPQVSYMRNELKDEIVKKVSALKKYNNYFQVEYIDEILKEFISDKNIDYNMMFRLYSTSIWIEKHNLRFNDG